MHPPLLPPRPLSVVPGARPAPGKWVVFSREADLYPLVVTPAQLAADRAALTALRKDRADRARN